MTVIAHTKNSHGIRQLLIDHLIQVAEQAAIFAQPFGASQLAYHAGLFHDIGKFHPAFQNYLLQAEQNPTLKQRGPDHKSAGAVLAYELDLQHLLFAIAGHHGGLPARNGERGNLLDWCEQRAKDPAVQEAIRLFRQALPGQENLQKAQQELIHAGSRGALAMELFVRLLFSCLVDSDFLDTERHFNPGKTLQRGYSSPIGELWRRFEVYHQARTAGRTSHVNTIRRTIYEHCRQAAEWAPGVFRLTAPTGGGKSLSSLAFALRHAVLHGKRRVIYAVPFMTITEQTADTFRSIFPDDEIVLEHHSSIKPPDDPNNTRPGEVWRRLAAENWDAPLIVTTTVQLFESLFANSTSSCRKLHNIAESIIILDEAQTLPVGLLGSILDALGQLVDNYGVSVVLCTATQPALHDRTGFAGLRNVRDIISNAVSIFSALSRVEYEWPEQGEKWTWQQVADRAKQEKQALVVVNTKKDAISCAQAFGDPAVLHLSTSMCGDHRRAVLQEAFRRLKDDEPCYLVSTQLIEAGVDIDFPFGMRAISPLSSIAQTAGRINREGNLAKGALIVFDPSESHGLPDSGYRVGIGVMYKMLAQGIVDPDNPETFLRYFRQVYRYLDLDKHRIQNLRRSLNYPEVAQIFRMIEDDTVPVVVFYDRLQVEKLLDDLQQNPQQARTILRQLQPFMVSLRKSEEEKARIVGFIEDRGGVSVWRKPYNDTYGLLLQEPL